MRAIHVLLQADVNGAYLQSLLGGRPVWLALPQHCWPKAWDGQYKNPVLRLRRALYGLQRSGFDWAKKARHVLTHHGWVEITDVIDSVFTLSGPTGMCILALYVDDVIMAGPPDMLTSTMNAIRGIS